MFLLQKLESLEYMKCDYQSLCSGEAFRLAIVCKLDKIWEGKYGTYKLNSSISKVEKDKSSLSVKGIETS